MKTPKPTKKTEVESSKSVRLARISARVSEETKGELERVSRLTRMSISTLIDEVVAAGLPIVLQRLARNLEDQRGELHEMIKQSQASDRRGRL